MTTPKTHSVGRGFILPLVAAFILGHCTFSAAGEAGEGTGQSDPGAGGQVFIYHLKPEPRGGRAYKLVYHVPVALEVYWRFKTDFESDFLVSHKYIREHRLISRSAATVLTENKYANGPDTTFRWRTTVSADDHRLSFALTNPEECGQRFHYGYIQIEPRGGKTRVTQVAYFDFWGVSLWAQYPWGGGMRDFLSYTAKWEQEAALRLEGRYTVEKTR